MALVSDPTQDGFNSYVSVTEADAYYAGTYFGDSEDWATFSPDKKERLLITATRKISALDWGGTPAEAGQPLPFPRTYTGAEVVFGNRDSAYTREYGYSYYPNVAPVPITGWTPTPQGWVSDEGEVIDQAGDAPLTTANSQLNEAGAEAEMVLRGAQDTTAAEIPEWLKASTMEWAMWLWTEGDRPATDAEYAMLKSQKIGPLDYQYRDLTGKAIFVPPSVAAILGQQGAWVIDMTEPSKAKSTRMFL
jgi:hypothetical protein